MKRPVASTLPPVKGEGISFSFNRFTLSPRGAGRGRGKEEKFDGFSKDKRVTKSERTIDRQC